MNLRNLAIWGVIVVVIIALYSVLNPNSHGANAPNEISYSQLLQKVDSDQVKDVVVRGEMVQAQDAAGRNSWSPRPARRTTC